MTTRQAPAHLEVIGDAVLAPSSHNTQPWIFAPSDDAIALYADRTRALPVNDPHDRELAISCGAALFTLRLSARARGLRPAVETLPDPGDPDLLARVRLGAGEPEGPDDPALLRAVPARFTHRSPFLPQEVPAGVRESLRTAAAAEGAWLETIDDRRRGALSDLVLEGDRAQFADHRWRRELASWMHPRRRGEGLSVPVPALPVAKLVVSAFDLGGSTGAKDASLARDAPMVAVLGTAGDDPRDWLAAGQALQRLLLVAAAAGLQASYLNQPCQVEHLRPRLSALLAERGHPQIVVRIGTPPDPGLVGAPRRPVEAVVETGEHSA